MKPQNDHKRTKHYRAYNDDKQFTSRFYDMVKEVSGDCWWVSQYLIGNQFPTKRKR